MLGHHGNVPPGGFNLPMQPGAAPPAAGAAEGGVFWCLTLHLLRREGSLPPRVPGKMVRSPPGRGKMAFQTLTMMKLRESVRGQAPFSSRERCLGAHEAPAILRSGFAVDRATHQAGGLIPVLRLRV